MQLTLLKPGNSCLKVPKGDAKVCWSGFEGGLHKLRAQVEQGSLSGQQAGQQADRPWTAIVPVVRGSKTDGKCTPHTHQPGATLAPVSGRSRRTASRPLTPPAQGQGNC